MHLNLYCSNERLKSTEQTIKWLALIKKVGLTLFSDKQTLEIWQPKTANFMQNSEKIVDYIGEFPIQPYQKLP